MFARALQLDRRVELGQFGARQRLYRQQAPQLCGIFNQQITQIREASADVVRCRRVRSKEAKLSGEKVSPLSGLRLAHPGFDGGEFPLDLERVTHPFERFHRGCPTLPFEQEQGAQDERRRRQSEGNENRSTMGNLHFLCSCGERTEGGWFS